MKKNLLLFEEHSREQRKLERMRGMSGMFSDEGKGNVLGPWYILTSEISGKILAVSRDDEEIDQVETEYYTEIVYRETWLEDSGIKMTNVIMRPDTLTPGEVEEIVSTEGNEGIKELYSKGTLVLSHDWEEELELWRYDPRKWDHGGWEEENYDEE